MYKILLFDLDGTLTDPKQGITKSVQYALKHFEVDEPDLDKLIRFIGPPLQQSFMEYYGLDAETALQAIDKYRERFSIEGIFENGVYEGIEEMLQALVQDGYTLGVATSKPYVFARRILDYYNLSDYFTTIVGSELDGTRSDKADVIQEVLKQLGLNENDKKHTLMIGDRKHDIIGAQTCGIDSLGVRFGYAEPNELERAGATYVMDSVEALRTFLIHADSVK